MTWKLLGLTAGQSGDGHRSRTSPAGKVCLTCYRSNRRRRPRNGQRPLSAPLVFANPESFEQLWKVPDGTLVQLHAEVTPWKTSHTWNVLGKIEGTTEKDQVILLSAHLDHLGVKDGKTYPGADDDASGTVAVMELARVLAEDRNQTDRRLRAVGQRREGLLGSRYFLQHPTFPLKNIVANLEFEMIGRPDPKLKPDELWLTGWERTDLGPELAQHGANWSADPHPKKNSSCVRTITLSRKTASSRKRCPATACTRTTTSPLTLSTRSIGNIWIAPSRR